MTRSAHSRTKAAIARPRAKLVAAFGGAIVGFGILGAGVAFAYWSTASSNPALAAATNLSAPTTPTATINGSGAITIGWTLPATQLPGAQYQVTRTSGPGNPTPVCTVAATVTSCQDTGLVASTSYGYSVVAVLDNWQSSTITTSDTTATPTFAISLSTGPYTVGTPITVQTVTAKVGASTDTTYAGAKTINWSGLTTSPGGHFPSYPSSSVTFTNGVASPGSTFTAYGAGSSSLTATDANVSSVTGTATVTINAGAGIQIAVVSGSGQSATVNTAFANPLVALVTDAYGNPVPGGSVTFVGPSSGVVESFASAGCTSNPQTYSCVAVTNASGDATSSTFTAGTVAGGPYNISASAMGTNTVNFSETDTAGTAHKFVFLTSPVSGQAMSSASLGPITVQEQDSFGNPTTTAETITLSSSSAGPYIFNTTLNLTSPTGSTTVNIPSGQSSVTFYYGDTKAGSPLITASGSLTSATQTETITAAALSSLTLSPSTPTPTAGTVFSVSLTALDQYGNTDTNYTGPKCVTFSGPASSRGGTPPSYPVNGSCSSGSAMTFSNGVAAGANAAGIMLYDAQSVTLTATDNTTGKLGTTSLLVGPATATKLVFSTEPVGGVAEGTNLATEPVVTVEDSYSNTVTSDTGAVALSIGSYSAGNGGSTEGSLGCTANTVNAVAGVASFASCEVTGTAGAGSYVLNAARSGLTTATSSNVSVTAGSASKPVFSTEPGGGANGSAWSTQPAVTVEDSSGNTVTGSSASITLAINSQPGSGATLSCTTNPVAASSGVADFAGCEITGTSGSYTLGATATSLTTATSSSFSITGIDYVQQDSITPAANATTVTPTLPNGVTAGDALILVVADESDSDSAVSSVSGGGVTWALAESSVADTNHGVSEIWYGLDSTGTSGSTAITVHLSAATNVQIADVSEWSGIASFDSAAVNNAKGTGTSICAGSVTPHEDNELLISDAYLLAGYTSQPAASNGFTELTQRPGGSGYYRGYGAYLVDASSSSISTTWTQSGGTEYWSAAIAAFEP